MSIMSKLGTALSTVGDVAVAMADQNQKIDELAQILVSKSYGKLTVTEARNAARVMISHAQPIVWK